jgi:hypothetical protein
MLVLDDVFARTWGDRARGGPHPDRGRGYWPTIIGATKAVRPDFAFWAEAYWDLEPVLLEQGFDACYDKRLYDRTVHGGVDVGSVRAHLRADLEYQRRTIRFVENHDEPRAASLLSPRAHRAALATVFTLPGVALLHEGESDGRRVRVPVTLGRRPTEPPDLELRAFVEQLLAALAGGMRRGAWALAPIWGWPDNSSAERLVGWTWTDPRQRHVIVVNLSDARADGRVQLPWTDLDGRRIVFDDVLSAQRFVGDGAQLVSEGLYVALDGHSLHFLKLDMTR